MRFRFTLRRKILLTVVPVILLMFFMGAVAVNQLRELNHLIEENYADSLVNVKQLGDAITEVLIIRERLILTVSATSPAEQLRQFEQMQVHADQLEALLNKYKEAEAEGEGESADLALLEIFDEAWTQAYQTSDQTARMALSGRYEAALLNLTGKAQNEIDYAVNVLRLVQDLEDNRALARFNTSQALDLQTSNLMAGLTIAASLLAFALAYWLARTIGGRVKDLVTSADEIAQGDYDRRIEVKGSDEISRLGYSFNRMAERLQAVLTGLEHSVAARTRDLELAADVGNRIAQVREVDKLLEESVEMIRAAFDLYYAQIYLVGANGRNLQLRAGTGDPGRELVRRGHHLPVGPGSINGTAAARREPVIVPDTGSSPIFKQNPLLPETRSEMAVPMVVVDRLVGVLNLQDSVPNALTGDNLHAYEAVANQLAIAIDNAHLFEEVSRVQITLAEQAQFMARGGWQAFLDAVNRPEWLGYSFEQDEIAPLTAPLADANGRRVLTTSIDVTGQPIGLVQVEPDDNAGLDEEDAELVDAVARQVAERIENLRLLAETDRYREEAESATRRLIREGWEAYQQSADAAGSGFVFDNNQVAPLPSPDSLKDSPGVTRELMVQGEKIGEIGLVDVVESDEVAGELLTAVAAQLSAHLENLRLAQQTEAALTETEKQARRRALLNQLSEELTRTQELDKIYQMVTSAALEMIGGDRVSLALLSEDAKAISIQEIQGDMEGVPLNTMVPLGGLVKEVVDTHQAVLRNDSASNLPDQSQFVSTIIAPLTAAGRVIGTLNIGSRQSQHFDETDRDLTVQMANILSSVVENRQLFSEMQERAEELAIINRVAETVSKHLEPEQLLKAVYDQIQRVMPIDAYHVGLYDAEKDQLDYPAMLEDGNWLETTPTKLRPSSNSYKVIHGKKPIVLNLSEADKEALTQAGATVGDESKPMTSSSVFVPLFSGAEVTGVLAVHSYLENAYDQADVALLIGIANHLAVALENARLFGQTEEALAETEAMYSASAELNGAQSYQDILKTLRQHTILGEGSSNISINYFDQPQNGNESPSQIRVIAHWDGRAFSKGGATYQIAEFPAAQLLLRVFEPILIEDINDDRLDENTRALFVNQFNAASLLFMPLDYAGERVGYINAVYPEPETFSDESIRRLVSLTGQAAVSVQNIRLLEQVQMALTEATRQSQELALINRVVSSVAATLDINESLQIVATELSRAVNVEEVGIALMNEDGVSLTVVAENRNPDKTESSLGYVIPIEGNLLTQKVLETRQPLTVLDAQNNALTAPVHDGMRLRGVQTLHIFPMIAGKDIIGTVGIDILEKDRVLTEQELQLAQTLVYQAATAVQNARLFAESQEHAEELAVLNEMGRTLTSMLDVNSILESTHQYVARLMEASDMYVALYDEALDEVDIRLFGEGEDVSQSALRRRAGNGITEYVLRSREPLLIKENIEEKARTLGFDMIGKAAPSWLGVPMTVGDKVVGMVGVQDFEKTRAFNEHHQDLLAALSSQVAIALENVRLFDREQARAQRERLIREITEQVRRSSNVDTIMRTAVREVGRALGRRTTLLLGDSEK